MEKDTEVQRLQVNIDQANRIMSSFEGTILDIHDFVMGNRQAAFHIETVDKAQVVDITLRIDSDGSHSVEREKTFIYVFSLLTNELTGERHFGLLVHDNIFEVDSDTLKRSLGFIAQHATALQGQYILTLNSDRASSDAPDAMSALASSVRARFTKQSRFLKKKISRGIEVALRDLYGNTSESGFTINFFMQAGVTPRVGLLAAPFFTTTAPIDALTNRGCEVRLVVRFSPATTPEALRTAFENPMVKVRYFDLLP